MLKIAGRTVGNILERKSESDFYRMLPAEGQKSKEAKIWTDRRITSNVVSNVHSAIITDMILIKKTKQFSERLVELFRVTSTVLL